MSLLDVVSELHLAWDAVPVVTKVFVHVQVSDSPLHVDVGRLFEEFTGDACSPDYFQVLPIEVANRHHQEKDQRVVDAAGVVERIVLRVV